MVDHLEPCLLNYFLISWGQRPQSYDCGRFFYVHLLQLGYLVVIGTYFDDCIYCTRNLAPFYI